MDSKHEPRSQTNPEVHLQALASAGNQGIARVLAKKPRPHPSARLAKLRGLLSYDTLDWVITEKEAFEAITLLLNLPIEEQRGAWNDLWRSRGSSAGSASEPVVAVAEEDSSGE